MSRVNQIKKILRDSAVEMDADDVLLALERIARYRPVARDQVSHCLHELYKSDSDIIRTRRGLYRYIDTQPPPVGARASHQPTHTPVRLDARNLATSLPIVVVETEYARRLLATDRGGNQVSDHDVTTHIAHQIELQFGATTEIRFCSTPWAAMRTIVDSFQTRHQPVVIIGTDELTTAAQQLAGQLGGSADTLVIAGSPSPPAIPQPPPPRDTRRQDAARLDSLSHMDDVGFHRRIHKVTGVGDTDALRRQALRVGETYAERWWSVVTHDQHELVIACAAQGPEVPGRLYADLLTFAEQQGLHLYGSTVVKKQLRAGFWTGIRSRRPLHSEEPTRTSPLIPADPQFVS